MKPRSRQGAAKNDQHLKCDCSAKPENFCAKFCEVI